MRKGIALIPFLIILLVCSACDVSPLNMEGTYESEEPKICIVTSTDPTQFGHNGELIQDDGSVVKIVLAGRHGKFFIYKFQEDGGYGPDDTILYSGEYKSKDDTIILKVDDGKEIILKKVEE